MRDLGTDHPTEDIHIFTTVLRQQKTTKIEQWTYKRYQRLAFVEYIRPFWGPNPSAVLKRRCLSFVTEIVDDIHCALGGTNGVDT